MIQNLNLRRKLIGNDFAYIMTGTFSYSSNIYCSSCFKKWYWMFRTTQLESQNLHTEEWYVYGI